MGAAQGAQFPQLEPPPAPTTPVQAVTEAVTDAVTASAAAQTSHVTPVGDGETPGPFQPSGPSGDTGREPDAGPLVPHDRHGALDHWVPKWGDQQRGTWRASGSLLGVPTGVLRLLGRRQQEGPGPPGGPAAGTHEGFAADEGMGSSLEVPHPLVRVLLHVREGPGVGPPIQVFLVPWGPNRTHEDGASGRPGPLRGPHPHEPGGVPPQANEDQLGSSQAVSRALSGYLSKAGAFVTEVGGLQGKQKESEQGEHHAATRAWGVPGWLHLPGSTTWPKEDEGSSPLPEQDEGSSTLPKQDEGLSTLLEHDQGSSTWAASPLEALPDQDPDETSNSRSSAPLLLPEQDIDKTSSSRLSGTVLLPDQDARAAARSRPSGSSLPDQAAGPVASSSVAVPPAPGQDSGATLRGVSLPNQETSPLVGPSDGYVAPPGGVDPSDHTTLPKGTRTALEQVSEGRTASEPARDRHSALKHVHDAADVASDAADAALWAHSTRGAEGVAIVSGAATSRGGAAQTRGARERMTERDPRVPGGVSGRSAVEEGQTPQVLAGQASQVRPAEGGAAARPSGLLETMGAVQQGLQSFAGRWIHARAPEHTADAAAPSSRNQPLKSGAVLPSILPDPVLSEPRVASSAVAARFGNAAASPLSPSAALVRLWMEVGKEETGEERVLVRLVVCPQRGPPADADKTDRSLMGVLHVPAVPAGLAGLFRSLRRGPDSPSLPSAQKLQEPLVEGRQGSNPWRHIPSVTDNLFFSSLDDLNQDALDGRSGVRGAHTDLAGGTGEGRDHVGTEGSVDGQARAITEAKAGGQDDSGNRIEGSTAGGSHEGQYGSLEGPELRRKVSGSTGGASSRPRGSSERGGLGRGGLGGVRKGTGGADENESDEAREERRAVGLKLLKELRRTAEEVRLHWEGCRCVGMDPLFT